MLQSGKNLPHDPQDSATRLALRISVAYCVAGLLWILFSDGALELLLSTKLLLSKAQTYKGWFFILFTALCLFVGLKRYLDNWAAEASRRIDAERALSATEAQYRRIVETAEEGIWVIDAQNRTVFVNQKLCAIFGYSETEMLGRPLFDFMDPEGIKIATRNIERRKQGIRESHEFLFNRKDGVRVWTMMNSSPMLENGVYAGSLAMVTDISERKRAEQELRSGRDLLAAAEQQAQLGSWRLEPSTGRLLCSLEMRRLLDCAPDAELNLDVFLSRIHPDEREQIRECFMSGQKSLARELRLQNSSNGTRVISFAYSASVDANGVIEFYQGIAQDITERKHTEDQLRQNQKMTAVGQLAGGIAHDFNNQLAAILGYAGMLRESLTNEKQQRLADKICIAAERSADLTKKLLAFSHKGTVQRVSVDVEKLLKETAEMLARSIDKRIFIDLQLNAPTCWVHGDPSQLQNAFLNLGLNARDAMPDGGTLRFQTNLCDIQPGSSRECEFGLAEGKYLCVSVSDTGVGMTSEIQRRLFEPFFTTKPKGKGTGLGLPSVYGTVRSHAGAIQVESAPHRGSTFKVFLPLHDTPAFKGKHSGRLTRGLEPIQCILLAEDEEDVRDLMRELLGDQCRELLVAKDGLQAIALYEQNRERIDVIVLDMQMPGASGKEVIAEIRRHDPLAKIVVTSGYTDTEVPDVNGFLPKPFVKQDLINLIARVARKPALAS